MKGVILAGGQGTRLRPITKIINKHLLPVYDQPMIAYPILTLKASGIKDILIVSSPEHVNSFVTMLGEGDDFGVRLFYEIQDRPNGIADALRLARPFTENEKIAMMLGDNILFEDVSFEIKSFLQQKKGAKVFLKEVSDPSHFGVAVFDKDKNLVAILEKPQNPPSNLAVVGLYLYNPDVYQVIERLNPSKRGELEITDVNSYYAGENQLSYSVLNGDWIDAGSSFESLHEAGLMVEKMRNLKMVDLLDNS